MMLPSTRILLVDDSTPLRAAMRGLLRSEPGFEVVGEAADGATAVRLARALAPDVVLMDVQMPGEFDGIEATRRIVADGALVEHVPLVIAISSSGEHAGEMLAAGAASFIPKDRAADLLDSIRDAIAARQS